MPGPTAPLDEDDDVHADDLRDDRADDRADDASSAPGRPSHPVAGPREDGAGARHLPPELRARPPRRMTLPSLGRTLGICVLLLPHTLIGLGSLGYAAFSVARGVAGTTVPVTVQKVWETKGSKNRILHHAQVQLVLDGRRVDREVSAQASTQVGDVMRVRHLGGTGVVEEERATRELFLVPLFAAFWCGVVGLFWVMFLGRRLGARWLCVNGTAVMGRVTAVRRRKSTTADVRYVVPGGGTMVLQASVDPQRRGEVGVGMQVPVLLHPQKPHWALAYGISVDAWWARPSKRT